LRARERARRKRDDAIVTAVRPPDRDLARIEVVLFHSAYGLTPGVRRWADRLRAVGYAAHTPDLYDGDVFEEILYPGAGHLFAEPGRREYNPVAAELMFGRALVFLRVLDGRVLDGDRS
jgi:dienelactone hydrolase